MDAAPGAGRLFAGPGHQRRQGMPEAGLSQALGLAPRRDWSMLFSALTRSLLEGV